MKIRRYWRHQFAMMPWAAMAFSRRRRGRRRLISMMFADAVHDEDKMAA